MGIGFGLAFEPAFFQTFFELTFSIGYLELWFLVFLEETLEPR